MTLQYGTKKVKGKILEVVDNARKEREKLQDMDNYSAICVYIDSK